MKKTISLILLLISLTSNSQSVRKYSNEFLNIGVNASAIGMANAVVANSGDVNSCYWNPAGLMQLETTQASLMHANYFANIAKFDYAAFAKPIDDRSAWGISMIRFGVDDILNTTQLIDNQGNIDYSKINLFSVADYGFTFSYARKLQVPGFQYGVNTKIIRRIIGNFANSWGFGFDIGLQFEHNEWQFGLMVRDVTTTYNVWSIDNDAFAAISAAIPGQNQDLPQTSEITLPSAQFGVAKKWEFHNDSSLLMANNLNLRFEKTNAIFASNAVSIDPAIGFEYAYSDLVFARAGVGNFQNNKQLDNSQTIDFQPNIGLGFQYRGIQIDYALTNLGNQSVALYSNVFSINIDLTIFQR